MEKITSQHKIELSAFIEEKGRTIEEIKRAQAILLISEKATESLVAILTGLKRASAIKARKKYLKGGIPAIESKRKEKKTRALLTKSQREAIKQILHDKTPRNYGWDWDHWIPSILGKLILELYAVKYKSKTSLYLIFKESKFTYHKPEKIYTKRNQELIDQWRRDNQSLIGAALQDKDTVVLVEDEMIVTSQTTTQKIWLPEGSTPFIECANNRKRMGFYGFLAIKSGAQHAFKSERLTSDSSAKFLKKVIQLYPGKKILLIWDNAPWHRGEAMRSFLNSCTNLHLINFPPYAPDENPQEHVWKAVRASVTHNKFISDIYVISREVLSFLNNTVFKYAFWGFTAS